MCKSKRVFVIDDDQDILDQARAILEAGGHEVLTASSGQEGLAVLETRVFDIILCDMMMEDLGAGLSVCREIKERGLKIPIYLVSDIGNLSMQNFDVRAEGFSGVLQKPFSANELMAFIK